ncbi:MAG: MotA/TolQ/ExbB proton channel family protein [Vicinamibacterales bacterium]
MRTLGCYAIALAQGAGLPSQPDTGSSDLVALVARSGPLAKVVLIILLAFSAFSWAIILLKLWQFRRAERQSSSFIDIFRKSARFSEVQAVCPSLAASPLVGLFQAGYSELNAQLRRDQVAAAADQPKNPEGRPVGPAHRPTLKSLDAVDRALLRASTTETTKLERRVPFLATTASITPFIGLFGTVWGIMDAFQEIGVAGSTSLGVVAPGIAQALIATAAGLFAAIPAVYFYNHLTHRVKEFTGEMDDFSLEFLNLAERNFT